MKDGRLLKRADTKKQEGCIIKRGSPRRRWDDCVERDLRKEEEEQKWRERPTTGSDGKYRKWSDN